MKVLYILIYFSFAFLPPKVYSQKRERGKKRLRTEAVIVLDSMTAYGHSGIFTFPNINKIQRYRNTIRLKEIARLSQGGRKKELYRVLKNYIHRFGIDNFRLNVPMLWQLARLSTVYGTPGEAILLYKLVLKHHQQGIDTKKLLKEYYDIETDKKEYYVPLDHYYELVALRKEIDTLKPPHSILVNMGDFINSNKEDYAPTIGNSDTMLLFTSKRNRHYSAGKQIIDEDIFYSTSNDGFWKQAQEFSNINTTYNEGSACLSADGNALFFSRCNTPDGMGNCDLYVSTLNEEGKWSKGINLGASINSMGWDSHPSLTHKGDTLFFASNRVGGFGLSDIYFSTKNEKGEWEKAQNLGPIINTRQSEVSPFFHHQFNVLYFSSNGYPLNFGDFDIYKSYPEEGSWGEPINVGPLVNGAGSEYYFTIDSRSKFLYYAKSSTDDRNNLDLHSFPVPMGAQPTAIATLTGKMTEEKTEKPVSGIVSVIDLDEGAEVAPKYLRPDGSFDFKLINKRHYLIIIQGDQFFRLEEVFFMDGRKEMYRHIAPIASKIEFSSLEFESDKADILPAMYEDLQKMAGFLAEHTHVNLIIHGHTDSAGKQTSNLKLSQDRADAIKIYLVDKFHIDASRIQSIGYGSSRPIVEEYTEEERKLNRRVEFEIYRIP